MSKDDRIEKIKEKIGAYPDFPKPGIFFRDIFPVLLDPTTFRLLNAVLVEHIKTKCPGVQLIIGLESRGFLFGPNLAQELNIGFVPIRKKGKLPGEVFGVEYKLEYGLDRFEIQKNSVKPGQKVVIVDDLLATGGTMKAACELMTMVKAEILECLVVIELDFLKGRDKLTKPIHSLIHYD
ncbi:adenine phosphoribosyltransferase-like [Gigantopelta aegis]|uniref:adenine phosphoribosyltransferase-like n=1 Tax=Gigantopelta aegis TaxID=1735272 RepID=UPI001B88A575|nr:adenine phosphoribosyltransferase-like [Gigantopelta aegis]